VYLARYNQTALDGIYKFTLQSKVKAAIQVVVGTLETYGEVLSPATCPTWVEPIDEVKILPAYAEGLVHSQPASPLIHREEELLIKCKMTLE
jgi:hypothetical protein